ncbi:MAG: hypothetical protein FWG68_09155, partial [Defluviitaleaceae bacterium]|nr:hypothetical protein [Defluviitaleaceae bacterium]
MICYILERDEYRNGQTSERANIGTDERRNGKTSERANIGTGKHRNGQTSERANIGTGKRATVLGRPFIPNHSARLSPTIPPVYPQPFRPFIPNHSA